MNTLAEGTPMLLGKEKYYAQKISPQLNLTRTWQLIKKFTHIVADNIYYKISKPLIKYSINNLYKEGGQKERQLDIVRKQEIIPPSSIFI